MGRIAALIYRREVQNREGNHLHLRSLHYLSSEGSHGRRPLRRTLLPALSRYLPSRGVAVC
jgi:hypothetical protein